MPTYDELDNEAAWRAEIAAPALVVLANGLRAHWPGAGVWIRGDNKHLAGYHRSRRWIKESVHCTNHTYSVSRTTGDRSGGDQNWCCAVDLALPQTELHAVCQRLDSAVRAGLLEKITEWYGNFGGDDRVDGYDNISNRIASSDSSHLTHLHMSFDRGRANEDHTDLLAILTGEDMSWSEVLQLPSAEFPELLGQTSERASLILAWTGARARRLEVQMAALVPEVAQIAAKVAALSQPAPVDIAALVAALQPALAAMEERLEAKLRDAVADLGEGGAAQVRAES